MADPGVAKDEMDHGLDAGYAAVSRIALGYP